MDPLSPSIGLALWMIFVFGMLFLVLRLFAWKPILSAIKKREQKIEDALLIAEKTRKEMEQLQFDNKVLYEEAKAERDEMLREARAIKETMIEEARLKADIEADRIIQAAKESIHFEKLAAITDLKNQLAKMSIDIAEKVLEKELSDPKKHNELIQREMEKLQI